MVFSHFCTFSGFEIFGWEEQSVWFAIAGTILLSPTN